MPLPSSAENQRTALRAAAEATGTVPGAAPAPAPLAQPAGTPNEPAGLPNAPAPAEDKRVTITKEEFNSLQAAKDSLRAAEARAKSVQDDLEALQSRLTELEAASKGSGTGDASPAPQAASTASLDTTQIPLTDKEKAEFEEDTIALMEKIATNVFRREIASYNTNVESRIGEVSKLAGSAVTAVNNTRTSTFTDKVKELVKAEGTDFDKVVSHQHWPAFTQAIDDDTGMSHGELIQLNIKKQQSTPIVKLFKRFHEKYIKDVTPTDGYEGAMPTGTNEVDTRNAGNQPEILKYSDREKLHKSYLARTIDYETYQTEKAKFDLADREGRVDYSK